MFVDLNVNIFFILSVLKNGVTIINDSYNANPESMRAFIDTIFEHYDDCAVILGDMGELGENEITYHKELGKYINSKQNLPKNLIVISIGNLSKNITDEINVCSKYHFDKIENAIDYIRNLPQKKIFLKASRSMKFERVIENI